MSRRLLLFRLTASLLALSLAILISEAAFRWVVAKRTPLGMIFEESLVYDLAPLATVYKVELNDNGFIGDNLAALEHKDVVVFLFGGSTSFSPAYVRILGKILERQSGKDVGVVSFGRPRYTSHSNRVLAERWIPLYRPDYVVLYLGINDNIYNTFPWLEGRPEVGFFDWKKLWPPMIFRLARYHIVQKRWYSNPDFAAGEIRSSAIFEKNLRKMIAVARREGAEVVLTEFAFAYPTEDEPFREKLTDDEPVMIHFWGHQASAARGLEAHNQIVRRLEGELGTLFAPVGSNIPKDSQHFSDFCHLKPRGNRILGNTVAAAIDRHLMEIEKEK